MNDTDLDFGNEIGRGLKAASAMHSPPVGLYPRVSERRRRLERRRARYRAGAVGIAAMTTIGGVAWARSTRRAAPTAGLAGSAALAPSANPDRIDAFPIVDSVPGVGASYGVSTTDQGWSGTVGIPAPDGAPSSIIGIQAFPLGFDTSALPTTPGRVAGVSEDSLTGGMTRLSWKVGEQAMSLFGDNADLMYQLVDIIKPIAPTPTRGGYTFTTTLPGGLVEIDAPYHLVPIANPMVDTNDTAHTFAASVVHGPLLSTFLLEGQPHCRPITINGRPGYQSTAGTPTIVIGLSSDETLFVNSETFTMDQLVSVAKRITITDEATWRAHYHITDQPTGPTTTLAG
jgi:hypothetical protein